MSKRLVGILMIAAVIMSIIAVNTYNYFDRKARAEAAAIDDAAVLAAYHAQLEAESAARAEAAAQKEADQKARLEAQQAAEAVAIKEETPANNSVEVDLPVETEDGYYANAAGDVEVVLDRPTEVFSPNADEAQSEEPVVEEQPAQQPAQQPAPQPQQPAPQPQTPPTNNGSIGGAAPPPSGGSGTMGQPAGHGEPIPGGSRFS